MPFKVTVVLLLCDAAGCMCIKIWVMQIMKEKHAMGAGVILGILSKNGGPQLGLSQITKGQKKMAITQGQVKKT